LITNQEGNSEDCKIGANSRFAVSYASVGIFYYRPSKFAAYELAQAAITKIDTVQGAANELSITGRPALRAAAIDMKKRRPQQYQAFRKSPEPLSFVLAAMENGVPTFILLTYTITR
jgi:hypothetical protein